MPEAPHRAGVAALLGRPNAGKSTLLNRLLGEKLAIVTARPQTTRSRLLGIRDLDGAQVLLVDTPGLHAGAKRLNAAMNQIVEEVARDCDVGVLLVDPAVGWAEEDDALAALVTNRGAPLLPVATKLDLPAARQATWPPERVPPGATCLRVSARTGQGIDALLAAIVARLPESPPLYPEGDLTDRPLRFLAAELVREAAFEALAQEIPYALAVEVISYEEGAPVRIRADLIVLRGSQKGIVIGAGGEMIKRIGTRARAEIERLVGAQVYLELWVKVDPSWAKRPARIRALGYC